MATLFQTKRPRHYADDIIAIKSRDGRCAALEKVPSQFKEIVRQLVVCHFDRAPHLKQRRGPF